MKTHTDQYRHDRIADALNVLDLRSCQDTMIRIPGRLKGLSNGTRRRLMFATVVLTNPSLLLIDEPTSGEWRQSEFSLTVDDIFVGLDGLLAQSMMDCMRRLADQGKTIICVLHQPSSHVFQTVDTLSLLAHGHLVYFGPRLRAQDFFASMDRHCPPHWNPAEYYIEQVSDVLDDRETDDHLSMELERPPLDWTEAVTKFEHSKYRKELEKQISTIKNSETHRSRKLTHAIDDQSNFCRQLKWLFWRSFVSFLRNPVHANGLLLQSVVPAIILGLLFFRLARTPEIVQNLNAISFAILTTVSYTNAFVILAIFPNEFQMFLREHRHRLYGTSAFYLTRVLSELPFFLVMPWLFTTIIYILAEVNGSLLVYLSYCAFVILATNAAVGFSGILAALAGSGDSALAAAMPLLEMFMLFGGFFLNNASVPFYFSWLPYCTWYYYAYSLMLILLWRDVKQIPCNSIGFCLSTGTDVLGYYKVDEHFLGFHLFMLFVLTVSYHLITFLIICIRVRRSCKQHRDHRYTSVSFEWGIKRIPGDGDRESLMVWVKCEKRSISTEVKLSLDGRRSVRYVSDEKKCLIFLPNDRDCWYWASSGLMSMARIILFASLWRFCWFAAGRVRWRKAHNRW